MPEIITLQIGNCGNSIGQQFWETVCIEHGIDETGKYVGDKEIQLRNISVYFKEIKELTYTPKSVMIDLDRRAVGAVRASRFGQIFNPDNSVFGAEGAGNNWAKGHFTEGAHLCVSALEVIRKEAEACDCLREFETVHSIGGGTGAGLGSLLISKLNDEYPHRLITTYSIIPSVNTSNCVVEPYNAVLTANYLIEHTSKTFVMDNDALYNLAANLDLTQIDFNGVNGLASCAMSGITSCVRFPGDSNVGFAKFIVNAIPFPRLHFFLSGLGPVVKREKITDKFAVSDVIASALNPNSFLAECNTETGTFITATCIFRGKLPSNDVITHMSDIKNKNSPYFVEWIPDNLKVAFCDVAPPNFSPMTTFIANTTSVKDLFEPLRSRYHKMFKRKTFLHWFIGEGMDVSDFEAAEESLNKLILDYKSYEENFMSPK